MAEHKKQHYVPKFYLKLFSQDGKHLWSYNLKSKDSFQAPIRNLCYEKYFYGKNLDFEKSFLNSIEQKQVETLRKLIDTQSLVNFTPEDFYNLHLFLLLQYTRTKDSKIFSKKMTEQIVSKYLKPMMKSSKHFKGIAEERIDSAKITFPEDYKLAMSSAIMGVELISDLKPILIINKSSRKFICSDAPVVLYNYIKIKNRGMTGFQSPGLQIFCPLNKDIILLLIDANLYDLKRNIYSTIFLNLDSDADSINKLQFVNCLNNVFFSEENDGSYVRNLHLEVEDVIKEKEAKLDTLHIAQNNDGCYSGIDAMYKVDSNYAVKLSFIKSNKIKNRLFKQWYKKISMSSGVVHLCRNEEIAARVRFRYENALKNSKAEGD